MKQQKSQSILKQHDLRLTEPRAQILDLFLQQEHALPHSFIEQHLKDVDRVTIYRTLRTFVGSGILHTIPDQSEGVKYALCEEHCQAHAHLHNHVHFTCRQCGATTCLEGVQIPAVAVPAAYKAEEANLIVQGLCPGCNQQRGGIPC